MQAVVVREFGGPDDLRVEEVEAPLPGPHEVLIDVHAAAVNFVDLLVISGKYQFLPKRPFSPGKLPVGVVSKIGSAVSNLQVGERVIGLAEHGAYADKALSRAFETYPLPNSMSFSQAASMSLGFDTAWFALRERARLRPGESVLVLGTTGSVGMAAMQLAKAFGARVLAGVSSMSKADAARDAGADEVIDLSVPNLQDNLRAQVHAVTEGRGADVIIDSLGDRFFAASVRSLAWCGRLVVVGFAAGEIPVLKVNYLLLKNIEVSGLQVSDYRKRMPERMRECYEEVFALFDKGVVSAPPFVDRPLSEFADALKQVRDRTATKRIVLNPGAFA